MMCNYNIYCHCEGKARGNLEKSNWITSLSLAMTNKKPRNKSFWVFYGAGDGSQLEPSPDIYLDILKNINGLSDMMLNIKSILKFTE